MKRRTYFLTALLLTATLIFSACGNTDNSEPDKQETVSITETPKVTEEPDTVEPEVIEPQTIELTSLKPLIEAGIITGIEELKIAESTEVDLNDLVFVDQTIIKSVDIDDSNVDYSKAGTYAVIYTITFDGEALRDYLEEKELTVDFDTTGEEVLVETTLKIEIITEAETEEAIAKDDTEVVTNETKSAVQSKNAAEAAPTAKPSSSSNNSSSNKNSGSTSNSSGSTNKPASSNTSSGNSSAGTSKPSSGSSGSTTPTPKPTQKPSTPTPTEKPSTPTPTPVHKHSYTSTVTKAATCATAGVRTYTCSCGDSYTESIPATGNHSWEHHDATGHTEKVLVQDAYDETVYEAHYICNQCGYDAGTNAEAMGVHLFSGDCENYSTKRVPVGTTHHDAVYDEQWVQDSPAYDKCTVCGATK